MSADAQGNDLSAVGIPLTGFLAAQLDGEPLFVASADGGKTPLQLPEGYTKIGLFTTDGGPEHGTELEEPLEFFQDGYKLGGGTTRTTKIIAAENNELVRLLIDGTKPDENGMTVVDGTFDEVFPIFEAVQYKNGKQERYNGLARVSEIAESKATRGEIRNYEITFEYVRSDEIGGYFRRWVIENAAAASAEE